MDRNSLENKALINRALSVERVLERAPSVGQEQPHSRLSSKYQPFPTIKFMEMFMRYGWLPTKASEVNSRGDGKGFQRHLIKFEHPETCFSDTESIQLVIINSTDGKCKYKLAIGIFRFICSNGLLMGDSLFELPNIKHIGISSKEVLELSEGVLKLVPQVANKVQEMKQIELVQEEKVILAKSIIPVITKNNENITIREDELLHPRRYEDRNDSLWTTTNVIQENMMKGGYRQKNHKTGKTRRTKRVTAIKRDVILNQALWTLAEEMKKLKSK